MRPDLKWILPALCAGLFACGDSSAGTDSDTDPSTTDPGTTAGPDASDTDSGTDPSTTDPSTTDPSTTDPSTTGNDTAADGEDCVANTECMSRVCEKFTDPATGSCVPADPGGVTRFMGTLRTLDPQADPLSAEIRVLATFDALGDPLGATPIVTGMSGADGVFDFVSSEPVSAPIAIVGLVAIADHQPTATGLARPVSGNAYGPAADVRDLWAVPLTALDAWNAALAMDATFPAEHLPIGDNGGVVGLVRDAATGAPLAGATVVSMNGPDSTAAIRYIDEAGTGIQADMTSSNGLFVLVNPSLAEEFEVTGVPGSGTGTAGSAMMDAVFVMVINVS